MIYFKGKTEDKLLQTILHKGVDLCSSLSTLMWGFAFTTKNKLSLTRPHTEATLRDSLVARVWGLVLLLIKTITMKTATKFIYVFVLGLLLLPSLTFANFDVSLKYGSKGSAVVDLQDFLTDQGTYTGKLDGRFGLGTLKSVKAWQTSVGLFADGYFGKASRAKADDIITSLVKDSNITEKAETGTISVPLPDGCSQGYIFSSVTGLRCDGTTPLPKPVTDTTTQNKIADLTQQVTVLNDQVQLQTHFQQQIAQNTAPSTPVIPPVVPPVVVPPVVVPPIKPSCTLTAVNQDPTRDYRVLLTWTTQGIADGTVGNLFAANRWVGGIPDFSYGNPTGSPILRAPVGTYFVGRSQDYLAVFGDINCTAKLTVSISQDYLIQNQILADKIKALEDKRDNEIAVVNQQIFDLKTKYAQDVVNIESSGVDQALVIGQEHRLLSDLGVKLDQLNTQIQSIKNNYSTLIMMAQASSN